MYGESRHLTALILIYTQVELIHLSKNLIFQNFNPLYAFFIYYSYNLLEELGSRAASALSVRSRKLSIVRSGQSLDG
jgi:hypothetical protein